MGVLRPPLPMAAQRILRVPGLAQWQAAVRRSWMVLAVLCALSAGYWRWQGGAPPVQDAMDTAGLALALAALVLAPALERLLAGLDSHYPQPWRNWRLAPLLLAQALSAALALSCTPLALVLAYDAPGRVAEVVTAGGESYQLPLALVMALVLVLCGPAVVSLATAALLLLRRWLGTGGGTLAWLAAVLALQPVLLDAGWWGGQPAGLGGYLQWSVAKLGSTAVEPSRNMFFNDLLLECLAWPVAGLLLAAALAAAALQCSRRDGAPPPGWTVPAAAVLAAAVRATLQTLAWVHSYAKPVPGEWQAVLATAAAVLVGGTALLACAPEGAAGRRSQLEQLLWYWWALCAASLCTIPYIIADMVTQVEVLCALGALLACITPCLLLLERWGRRPAGNAAALLLLLACATPLSTALDHGLPAQVFVLGEALLRPEQAAAAYWVLAAMGMLAATLWLTALHRRRVAAAAGAAPPA